MTLQYLFVHHRRRSLDLTKTIVLLCVLAMSSLTVKTLPQIQRVLDAQDYPMLLFSSAAEHGHFLRVDQLLPGGGNDSSVLRDDHKADACLKHTPITGNSSRVAGRTNSSAEATLWIRQPTTICGTLQRRELWESNAERSSLSPLALEIARHQSNCTFPTATFHVDNDFGLGSHLYLWSQAFCNAWQEGYRVQTNNPVWLWRDQTYCRSTDPSPLTCYFPLAETQCPGQQQKLLLQPVNVSDPRNSKLRCRRIQSDPAFLTEFRAAAMEFLFYQALSPLIIREAERQLGVLFKDGVVPHNLIAVHMRWGDKFWEMDLAPVAEYLDAVAALATNRTEVHVYLACEDPRAVHEFISAAPSDWQLYVDRTVEELSAFRPTKGNRASWTTRNTKGRAGLVALGSLLVALEANDFVLTTKSNWSRVLNDLRKNVLNVACGNCTKMIDLRPGEW